MAGPRENLAKAVVLECTKQGDFNKFNDFLTDWLADWLFCLLTHSLADWLTDSFTDSLTHSLTAWLTHSLTAYMTDSLDDRLSVRLTHWLSETTVVDSVTSRSLHVSQWGRALSPLLRILNSSPLHLFPFLLPFYSSPSLSHHLHCWIQYSI